MPLQLNVMLLVFFFSSRRRHTRLQGDWSSDVCSSDLSHAAAIAALNDQLAALLDRAGPYDLVYERYSLWSLAAMEHAATAGVPGLLEVNAPLIEEQAAYRGLRDAGGADRVATRAFRAASVLLAVSAEVAAWLERRGVAPGRVHVI